VKQKVTLARKTMVLTSGSVKGVNIGLVNITESTTKNININIKDYTIKLLIKSK